MERPVYRGLNFREVWAGNDNLDVIRVYKIIETMRDK